MIELNKEDYDYCKTVYEELLSGAYSKDKVKKAYELMFGNSGQVIHNKKKRAQVFSYWTKEWVELKGSKAKPVTEEEENPTDQVTSEALMEEDDTQLDSEENPTDDGLLPTNTEEYEIVFSAIKEKEAEDTKWNAHTIHLATGIDKDRVKMAINLYHKQP